MALFGSGENRADIPAVTPRPVPDSLLLPGLVLVWNAARERLDRFGPHRRGTIECPSLDLPSSRALTTLLSHKLSKRIDLEELEQALRNLGIVSDLCNALTRPRSPPIG